MDISRPTYQWTPQALIGLGPHNPSNPDPRELSADTSDEEIKVFLTRIARSNWTSEKTWYLYDHAVSFEDGRAKTNWSSFAYTEQLKTWAQCFKAKRFSTTSTRISFHLTWSKSWVGMDKEGWSGMDWHAWGSLLDYMGGRKRLVIFDCNSVLKYGGLETIRLQDLMGQQKKFVEYARKSLAVDEVYIGGSGNREPGLCMELTGRWIMDMCVGDGEGAFPWAAEDLVRYGFRPLRLDKKRDR